MVAWPYRPGALIAGVHALSDVNLGTRVADTLRDVLGSASAALHEPMFVGNEWRYVKNCLDTGWVSSVGSYVDRFEADMAAMTGSKYAIATVNGTAAPARRIVGGRCRRGGRSNRALVDFYRHSQCGGTNWCGTAFR